MRDENWLIVDTETDGLMEPIHVVEIAAQRMRGWERDGEPFRVLVNHDVPIHPEAEALHGYSRDYLRRQGEKPHDAHAAWATYAADLPIVAYNLSFDWNRALDPEYSRLGLQPAGRRGFCAMTLSRRVIQGTKNYKLETLKEHYTLNIDRSHQGRNDVATLVALFERILAPRLYQAGVVGFESVAEFSRRTPVVACQEHVNGVGEPVWFLLDNEGQAQGPFPPSTIRELSKSHAVYVWREGMAEWILSSDLPDFATPEKKERGRRKRPEKSFTPAPRRIESSEGGVSIRLGIDGVSIERPNIPSRDRLSSLAAATTHSNWTNELIGLCKGFLADGIINTQELVSLQDWLISCPCTEIFPISAVAEVVENIVADGIVTEEELERLKWSLEVILPAY